MRESRTYGFVRGVPGDWHPYRDRNALLKAGNKNDRVDARKLSDLLRAGLLTPIDERVFCRSAKKDGTEGPEVDRRGSRGYRGFRCPWKIAFWEYEHSAGRSGQGCAKRTRRAWA
jgi:hypothetical protein